MSEANTSAVFPVNENYSVHLVERKRCSMYDFVVEGVLMAAFCLLGFTGNGLSMLCLSRDRTRSATPFILISLAIFDTLFLITVVFLRVLVSIPALTVHDEFTRFTQYCGFYTYPFAMAALTGTIYLTVLVTVNRFIAVCMPYRAAELCSFQQARRQVAGVVLFALVYNIPRFFEYRVTQVLLHNSNETIPKLSPAPLQTNKLYKLLYLNLLYFLVMFMIPLCSLIYLNLKLIRALGETRERRSHLINRDHTANRSEDDITLMLIVVVLVFVICQLPAFVTQLIPTFVEKRDLGCPSKFFYFERISDLLVVLNSSINFIIYCFCSPRFRQALCEIICTRKQETRNKPEFTMTRITAVPGVSNPDKV